MPASEIRIRPATSAERTAALMTEECLETRARRGDRAAFESVPARVPDVEPEPADRL